MQHDGELAALALTRDRRLVTELAHPVLGHPQLGDVQGGAEDTRQMSAAIALEGRQPRP
jgi:hypothetical protein